ncbi:MAG: hypothetical protein LBO74_15785 [Candidatus Symbiothrix sp.]|jgi:hypothetical protein|nr:hypothetical protein [Candidatus Symbiothrix sp.]
MRIKYLLFTVILWIGILFTKPVDALPETSDPIIKRPLPVENSTVVFIASGVIYLGIIFYRRFDSNEDADK